MGNVVLQLEMYRAITLTMIGEGGYNSKHWPHSLKVKKMRKVNKIDPTPLGSRQMFLEGAHIQARSRSHSPLDFLSRPLGYSVFEGDGGVMPVLCQG